ncbi:MAG: hypothetical protein NC543_06215 [bacterium]|nr:hypothetical protein [bacterium]MCM1374562.1 hypothetical protein [Muribaculum sp.]
MFKKVQFIGTAICTTPANLNSIEETSDDGYYAGLPDDDRDLTARVNLVKQSIQTAILSKKADLSRDTLKVFVFPEFFMRGVLGAYYSAYPYLAEVVLVDQFQNVLRELAESGIAFGEDYLFVLGTILSSKSKIDYSSEPDASLYQTGDHLLDVYYRLHPEEKMQNGIQGNRKGISMSKLLKRLDEKHIAETPDSVQNISGDAPDDAYVDILKKTLDYCDAHASLEIGNRCLIISGADILSAETGSLSGSAYEPVVVQKKYKSKEDFILNNFNSDQITSSPKYLQTTTRYYDIDTSEGERKKCPADGLAIFEYNGLKIGIDICLDHSRQRLVNHLYQHPDDYVDLQIVTSCGMSVRANAVIAKDGGIVFNCDGEYELQDSSAGVDGNCCHTSLQRVTERISVKDNKVTANAVLEAAYPLSADIPCTVPEDAALYRFRDYQIHIYEPLNLN